MSNRRKIWGVSCVVPSCGKLKRDNLELKFFKFPDKGTAAYDKWMVACSLQEPPRAKTSYVCSCHFSETNIGKKRLKNKAIPSLNLNYAPKVDEQETFDHMTVRYEGKSYSCRKSSYCENQNPQDLTFEELEHLDPMNFKTELNLEPPKCNNCIKSEKDCEFYRSRYANILKKYKRLKENKQVIRLKEKHSYEKFKRAKNRNRNLRKVIAKPLSSIIDSQPNVSENAKTLCKMILCKKSKYSHWEQNERELASELQYKSAHVYRYFREVLEINFPSPSSIQRWQLIKKTRPGFNSNITENLKILISKWSDDMKETCLVFDEISIRKGLCYDAFYDEIMGYIDDGNKKDNIVGKYIVLFMIRGLFSNWKYIISYYVTEKPINGEKLKKIVNENIDYCHSVGLNVRNLTCDQGSNNRCCYDRLNITPEKPYFYHNSKRIYGIYDPCHLIKSARNTLLKKNVTCPDGLVTWKCLEELYEAEKNNVTKMTHKLTFKHIRPNNWQKMKVKYATQVFSHTVSAAVKTAFEMDVFSTESAPYALSTAKYLEFMNHLFDCLNSKGPFNKNIYKSGLKCNNEVRVFLEESIAYLESLSFEDQKKSFWVRGFLQTIRAVLQLSVDLLEDYSKKNIS